MSIRAAIYARVSSAQQREAHTIENQLRTLPAYVAAQGWQLVGTYIDDGRSAKAGQLEHREGFARMMRDAEAHRFDVLVIVDVDRLTRTNSIEERAQILGPFQRLGIQIVTPSSGVLDLRSFLGEFLVTVQALVAAEENRKRAERIRAGKLTSAGRGGKSTGPDPYGHRYLKPENRWEVDPERAPFVVELYERIADGESCISIACDFAARGVPCSGRQWNKALVRYIARSTRPIGEYVAHRKTRTTIAVPPLVDVELWQRAQDALTTNRKNGLRRTKYIYLLEGLGVCGVCGGKMRMRTQAMQKGRWLRKAAYVCERRHPYLPRAMRDPNERKCSTMMLVEVADALAWEAVCREIEDPDLPGELAHERRGIAANGRAWDDDVAGYEKHLARLDKVSEAVMARFRRGLIEEHELDRELAAIRRERTAVSAQLKTAKKALGKTANAQARICEATALMDVLRAKAAAATAEERREIAMTLIDAGGAVFIGDEIRLALAIERPASARGSSSALVGDRLYSDDHQSHLRIRLVARR